MSRSDHPSYPDPDLEFGLIIRLGVKPETIYDDEIRVWRLIDTGNVFWIEHSGTDDDLALGAAVVLQEYGTYADAESVRVWESTQVTEHKFVTTILYLDHEPLVS